MEGVARGYAPVRTLSHPVDAMDMHGGDTRSVDSALASMVEIIAVDHRAIAIAIRVGFRSRLQFGCDWGNTL